MPKYSKGRFQLKNPEKYIGINSPIWRSSWEHAVMQKLDTHPAIDKWASESIRIPYRNPLTGKITTYVPDFFVSYIDKNNQKFVELWEVKPEKQAFRESVGKSKVDQAQYIVNMAKWEAAREFCRQRGIHFRIITENDLFVTNSKRKR